MTKTSVRTSGRISRRQLLKAAGGTAALLAAAKLNFPAGAFAQGAGPEVTGAKLGGRWLHGHFPAPSSV